MAESVTATSECSPGFSTLRVWQLPAPTTRLRQVLLCVDKPASSRALELTGADCHGHSPLHQLNTGHWQELTNHVWSFFQQPGGKCKG